MCEKTFRSFTSKYLFRVGGGERGGNILVTAGIGGSGEGGVNRKDPNFIFGVMGR